MALVRAGNTAYQQLAKDPDVLRVAEIFALNDSARGPVAAFLRGQVGKKTERYADQMRGLEILLSSEMPGSDIAAIKNALDMFYHARLTDQQINERRGMVLELAVYFLISSRFV